MDVAADVVSEVSIGSGLTSSSVEGGTEDVVGAGGAGAGGGGEEEEGSTFVSSLGVDVSGAGSDC